MPRLQVACIEPNQNAAKYNPTSTPRLDWPLFLKSEFLLNHLNRSSNSLLENEQSKIIRHFWRLVFSQIEANPLALELSVPGQRCLGYFRCSFCLGLLAHSAAVRRTLWRHHLQFGLRTSSPFLEAAKEGSTKTLGNKSTLILSSHQ